MGLFKEFYLNESKGMKGNKYTKTSYHVFKIGKKDNKKYGLEKFFSKDAAERYKKELEDTDWEHNKYTIETIKESIDEDLIIETLNKSQYIVKKESLIDWYVNRKDNPTKWIAHIGKEKLGYNVKFNLKFGSIHGKDDKYFFRSMKEAIKFIEEHGDLDESLVNESLQSDLAKKSGLTHSSHNVWKNGNGDKFKWNGSRFEKYNWRAEFDPSKGEGIKKIKGNFYLDMDDHVWEKLNIKHINPKAPDYVRTKYIKLDGKYVDFHGKELDFSKTAPF